MLRLPDVTLVAVDAVCHDLLRLSLEQCLSCAEFADVVILSDRDIGIGRHMPCEARTMAQVQELMWYAVPREVRSTHFLIAQWDSWITHPELWRDEWLTYDYIGAPWPFHQELAVGNGGFSLRSARLTRFVAEHKNEIDLTWPEDSALCRTHRRFLESCGFRWAPDEVASSFSFEHTPPHATFGFHGMFNWPHVLSEDQIAERISAAPPYVLASPQYQLMLERLLCGALS
jgi:hypothetical protein